MKISSYTQQSPIFQIYHLNSAIQAYYAEHLKAYKLNFAQALILLTIYFEGKSKLSPMSLVRGLGLSKSSVSQALSGLEQLGWIKRKMDEADARSLCLVLTAEGKSQATKIIAIFDRIEKKFEKLGKERLDQLTDSLKLVNIALKGLP